jgi:hypothetical protein
MEIAAKLAASDGQPDYEPPSHQIPNFTRRKHPPESSKSSAQHHVQ